jgi:hypothetical protein
MENPRDSEAFYCPALLRSRSESSRRRAAAFGMSHDTVLGVTMRPITPASYSLMHATGSAFLFGKTPEITDVMGYVWFHSLRFTSDPRRVLAEKKRAHRDFYRGMISLPTLLFSLPRRRARIISERYAAGALKISEIVDESFADAPPPSNGESARVNSSLEGQLIDVFAREYGWDPDRTRHTPLRQLYQLLRCINAHHLGSAYIEFDREEASIIAAELSALNTRRN